MTRLQSPRAAVIGFPVAHSRSPKIHGYWLDTLNLPGSYEAVRLTAAELPAFIGALGRRGYAGCNVTVPHKEAVLALCDSVTEGARAVGAVNTIWLEDGRVRGDNSDVFGFLANLDEAAPGWDGTADATLVLGAGGAARAVIYALLQRGMPHIYVANRTLERAQALAGAFGPGVEALAWDRIGALLNAFGLVVNTTSLGMQGQPPLALRIESLPSYAIVCDIVYVPLETGLVVTAKARGLRAAGGLGMLLHQAVLGFQHWFGATPTVTPELRALISADIPRRL